MARRPRDSFSDSALRLTAAYNYYFDRLMELSLSCFTWENLPETVDEIFLERALFEQGQAVFYFDDDMGAYTALRCSANGPFNVYGIPIRRRAYGYSGYNKALTIGDSVIIYNNMIRSPALATCKMFALKLARISRVIDVNINAQKTPVMIKGTEQQMLTLQNLYQKYEGDQPVIFGDKNLDLDGFGVLKTDAPFVAPAMKDLHERYWNEALTYLGIANVSIQKRERLTRDEVLRSMGGTLASRKSRLKARERACKLINSKFGLNVSVSYDDNMDGAGSGVLAMYGIENLEEGGAENG